MKKLLLISFVLFGLTTINAQKLSKSDLLSLEKKIYKQSIQNYDLETAKNSVYHIMAIEGENSSYLDSLAYIYFNKKNFMSYISVADKILKKEEKLPILERKAIALENLGATKEAIAIYEKVYAQKKDVQVAYKLASLQHQLKRTAEAYSTLKSAEKLKFPEKAFLAFPSSKKDQQQRVPFKAVYFNLLAMTAYDLHNYDVSLQYLEDALKVFPDFFVAKQNKNAIAVMKQKLEGNNKQQAPQKNNN